MCIKSHILINVVLFIICLKLQTITIPFFNKEEKLGMLTSSQLEKYNYDEVSQSYIIKIEEIANIDNCYNLKLSSGIHTFEEMFEESLRIVDEEESDSFYSSNVVYGLLKAMRHARKGDIILFHID